MKKLFFLLAAVAVSSHAAAAPDAHVVQQMVRQSNFTAEEVKRDYEACDSGVPATMAICASYNLTVQDIRLNRVYKLVLAKAKTYGYDKSLVAAQKAWLVYRDTACKFEGEMGAGGGSGEKVYMLACMEGLTSERADRLEAEINNGRTS